MDFIWLIVGGIVGLLASVVMKTDGQQNIFGDIALGIAGALLAGWIISPLIGFDTVNQGFSMGALIVALLGALILLAIVKSVLPIARRLMKRPQPIMKCDGSHPAGKSAGFVSKIDRFEAAHLLQRGMRAGYAISLNATEPCHYDKRTALNVLSAPTATLLFGTLKATAARDLACDI
jgi:uncharacterized membrane protein YeaQ/YmgE (transglycosylase-associated protein family)